MYPAQAGRKCHSTGGAAWDGHAKQGTLALALWKGSGATPAEARIGLLFGRPQVNAGT